MFSKFVSDVVNCSCLSFPWPELSQVVFFEGQYIPKELQKNKNGSEISRDKKIPKPLLMNIYPASLGL